MMAQLHEDPGTPKADWMLFDLHFTYQDRIKHYPHFLTNAKLKLVAFKIALLGSTWISQDPQLCAQERGCPTGKRPTGTKLRS